MADPTVTHDTFVLERDYPIVAEQVFGFFADAGKKRRWYAASDSHAIETFEMDFREGGAETTAYRMGESTPFPGAILANQGTYEDIVPNRRVVLSTAMSLAGRRISVSLVTVELLPKGDDGTRLVLTHQGVFFEGSGGPRMRQEGWNTLLNRLDAAIAEDRR